MFVPLFVLAALARGIGELPRKHRPAALMVVGILALFMFLLVPLFVAAGAVVATIVVVAILVVAAVVLSVCRQPTDIWDSAAFGDGAVVTGQPKSRKADFNISPEMLGELEWKAFEVFCCHWLTAKGYTARRTSRAPGRGADGGIDIEAYHSESPAIFVQCKAWTKAVGVQPMREFYGAIASSGRQ